MAGRLRWKKAPHLTGLMAIGAGPRGSCLHDGVKEYASINALGGGSHGPLKGWYWVAFDSVPYRNTCGSPCDTEAEAKSQATAYVKQHLGATP